jgi:hypothetical protein
MATKKTSTALAALAVAALAACGGGGDDAPQQPQLVVVAPGMYIGTTNTGGEFVALQVENGDLWALYVVGNDGGMIHGGSAVPMKDYSYTPARPVSLSFTSASSTAVGGTFSDGINPAASFNGTKPAGYDYNQPVSVSTISGRWAQIPATTGENLTFDITVGGAVSGFSSGGCTFAGVVAPHGNKQLYDVNISFGPAPCVLAGQTAKGVAIGDQSNLIVMLVDNTKQYGLLTVGTR